MPSSAFPPSFRWGAPIYSNDPDSPGETWRSRLAISQTMRARIRRIRRAFPSRLSWPLISLAQGGTPMAHIEVSQKNHIAVFSSPIPSKTPPSPRALNAWSRRVSRKNRQTITRVALLRVEKDNIVAIATPHPQPLAAKRCGN
jgi:hypothetical protein